MSAIGGFELDATVVEDHVMSAEATDDPVEAGAPINDHVRRLADTLTLECIISDSPIGRMIGVRDQEAGAASTRLIPHPGGIVLPEQGPIDPYRSIADEGRAYMRQLMDTGERIVVETAVRIYDSMVLLTVAERRDAQSGKAFHFTAQLKQIRVVTNDRSVVRVANPAAQKPQKKGHKTGYPTGPLDQSVKAASARIKARKAQRAKGNAPVLTEAENAQLERDLDTVRGGQAAQARLDEWKRAHPDAGVIHGSGAAGHF